MKRISQICFLALTVLLVMAVPPAGDTVRRAAHLLLRTEDVSCNSLPHDPDSNGRFLFRRVETDRIFVCDTLLKLNNSAELALERVSVSGLIVTDDALLAQTVENYGGTDLTPLTAGDYESHVLSNPFLGFSNRKLYGLWASDDHITVIVPAQEIPFTCTDNGNPAESICNLPDTDTAEITYDLYLGGDIAEHQPDYVVCIRAESVILSSAGNGTTK